MICDGCKYADWHRTSNGRLHPDRQGRCTYKIPEIIIPAAFHWMWDDRPPRPSGGGIERGATLRRDCPVREETTHVE
jgi:hypothetical protein